MLGARRDPERRLRKSTFEPALARRDRLVVAALSAGWLVCIADFWLWWLRPAHRASYVGLAINSVLLLYVTLYPTVFVLSANHLHRVRRSVPIPQLRVAFVVTRAPSEPFQMVSRTLRAMLIQDYPFTYDVWLCDERPSNDVIAWCQQRGVRISTRDGAASYQRDSWPRRVRCKEGNLSYFYDHWGYRRYDAVAQLDCDQVPSATYLASIIRPFSDPAVGYVAAPSVCDTNAAASWAARGRVYREATFHGPFQLGYSKGYAPLCIGSHYAVRTAAIREIGGIGPELAEDFSTTFLLNAAGWQGVFAIDADAHGYGPATFQDMVVQEFQWARSLAVILLGLVPRNLRLLSLRLRLRFLYALSYYLLLSGVTLAGLTLAPIAAVTGQPWINVNLFGFLAHIWSVAIWLILITALLRRRGLLRPPSAPILSWEAWLYSLTRWPYVGLGVVAAVQHHFRPRSVNFKITPKEASEHRPLPARLVAPFAVVSLAASAAALYGERSGGAAGYVFLCVVQAATYALAACAVTVLHGAEIARRSGARRRNSIRAASRGPLNWAVSAAAASAIAVATYPAYAIHVFGW